MLKSVSRNWLVLIDGSSRIGGAKVGIILYSSEGEKISYALKLEFKETNNKTEYEAFITYLNWHIIYKYIQKKKIKIDS